MWTIYKELLNIWETKTCFCVPTSFNFVNIHCSQIMLIDNLYFMFKFHVCSSEIQNSFVENKMNNRNQIENTSASANRTKSHDP